MTVVYPMGYVCQGPIPYRPNGAERFDQRQARGVINEKLKAAFACPLDLKLEVARPMEFALQF